MNYFCSLIPTSHGCASVSPHLTDVEQTDIDNFDLAVAQ
jgi:hypothetical protein